jgi:hypothetical protein
VIEVVLVEVEVLVRLRVLLLVVRFCCSTGLPVLVLLFLSPPRPRQLQQC